MGDLLRSADPGEDPGQLLADLAAALERADAGGDAAAVVVFEHGGWYAIVSDDEQDRMFAVVDCQTATGEDYLDLEEL